MEHPLARVVDRIDPDARYRTVHLAELLGLAVSSTGSLALSGWFPGHEWEPSGVGGRRLVWTGAALIAAADTDPPALDHEHYARSTTWRLGCGCDDCLAWHNADSRDRRRAASDRRFPPKKRERLLNLIAARKVTTIDDAAERVGVTPGLVRGLALRDPDFRARLDEAAVALCAATDLCGRPGGYRAGCRGTMCRRAKTPLQ